MFVQSLTNAAKTRIVEVTTITVRGVDFEVTLQVVIATSSPHSYARKRLKKESDIPITTNYLTIAFPDGGAEELQIVFGEIFPEKGIKVWLKKLGLEKLLEELVERVRTLQESAEKADRRGD